MTKYDFSGYATKNDLRCGDGRIIRKDAFKENHGKRVPLVYQHNHSDLSNVLGHADLENRADGVYAYCSLNNSSNGQMAKEAILHGDIDSMSIYANRLQQNGHEVIHGSIKEVSLVIAGANPGAKIDNLNFLHSDGMAEELEDEAIVYTGLTLELCHEDSEPEEENDSNTQTDNNPELEHADDETVEEIFNTFTPKQQEVLYYLIGKALENSKDVAQSDIESEIDAISHAEEDEGVETIADIFNTLNEKQKTVAYALIGYALENAEVEHSEEGDSEMKHNVFDNTVEDNTEVLSHSEMEAIFADAKRGGSLADAVLAHGITNIEYLFPDARNIENQPGWIKRDTGWVSGFMNAAKHLPFARVKMQFADIREDEARAKGYIKGDLKKEEVFSLLKRTVDPQTVYKKQKLDRDDIVDIVDFDVVTWMKGEMRMMLDEEIARAALVGDGRLNSDNDKIKETHIIPIWKDAALYTVPNRMAKGSGAADFIKAAIRARKNYKGSGNPNLYTTEDMLTEMLLLTDTTGRDLYESVEKLATKLRVKEIITVEVMENLNREVSGKYYELNGIIVNPADYAFGADKGGAVNMFDDFDIDYNAQKYLIETRCSGALTKPFSALVIETEIDQPNAG